MKQTTDVECNR